jgi:putative N6-adenine-specific DNA methylase
MALQRFFATCPRGLETGLAAELAELGAQELAATDGGVRFAGGFDAGYRANLHSRIASRILWQIGHAPYRTEHDIFAAAKALPWPQWFAPERTIRVGVAAIRSPVKSLDFVTLRIKDAVCDAFRAASGRRPDVDTHAPDVRIHAFLTAHEVTLYLDTSGDALFKRGYRTAAGEAPIRENLAAGILRLSGWQSHLPLLDPMCGSGTFLTEAAMMARGIAPGLNRRFAFEHYTWHQPALWQSLREHALLSKNHNKTDIYGSDRYGAAIDMARANLEALGLTDAVTLKQAHVLEMPAPAATGVLVTNPPYGVRLDDHDELAAFYPKLGDALKRKYAGWTAYIFTGDLRLPKLIGLAASRRTPLYNGALECRLFEFRLVAGSMRKRVAGSEPGPAPL